MTERKKLGIKYLENLDKFDLGNESILVLQEEYGFSYDEIKNRIKKYSEDTSSLDLKDICNLFNVDYEKMQDNLRERIKIRLGDNSKIEWWLNYLGIPINDRMQIFQLFVRYMKVYFEDDKNAESMIKDIGNNVENIHYFNVEPTLSEILNHTDSDKTELPFDSFFISTDIIIDKRKYLGFLIMGAIDEETGENLGKQIICFEQIEGRGEEAKIAFSYNFTNFNEENKVVNFIYSFANFLNEREVKVIQKEFNFKNNERRKNNGRTPLPVENIIKIDGSLKLYYENLSIKNENNCYYSVWIRGHFFHFRNKSFWKGIYSMSEKELIKNNYVKKGDLIRFWKKPFINGRGDLRKSFYFIRK